MKKTVLSCLVLVFSLVLSAPAMAKLTLKVANSGPENIDNRTVRAGDVFSHVTREASNGELELVFYHASKLGAEREALEGIQMGTIQMGTLTSGPVPGFFAPVMFFDIPFLLSSNAGAWEFLKSDFVKDFSEEFRKKTGIRILAVAENGFRHFTVKGRELKSPADMKALKIRTMESPAHMAMVKALGADPTPIAFSELYMALQQGVVDGMECPVALIHDMKFYEVQDSMVMDGHFYNPMIVYINDNVYKKLTPQQQAALQKGADAFVVAHAGFNQQINRSALVDLEKKGMKIYKPTPEELAEFRAIAQPAGLTFIEEKIGKEWVAKAMAAAAAAEKSVEGKQEQIVDDTIAQAEALLKAARAQ